MPALNFTLKSKINKVLSGECCQTIRPPRKYPIKKNDKLYLYTGMRTKQCIKLGEGVCSKVIPIKFALIDLFQDGTEIFFCIYHTKTGKPWPIEWIKELAKNDGFLNLQGFYKFFIKTYKLKIGDFKEFDIIKWRDFEGIR